MPKGKARNLSALPKLDKIRDGGEPQPGDEIGAWPRGSIQEMDSRFCARMRDAIRKGGESAAAITATIRTPTKRR
jgi:hypothetical protein